MLEEVEAIARAYEEGRKAWPRVTLPIEVYARHVEDRLAAGVDLDAALGALRLVDLFLACACAAGDRHAIEAFERALLANVPAYVARVGLPEAAVAELGQALRTRLFVAIGEAPAKIHDYGGTGPLEGWLRVVAVRMALSARRGARDHRPVEEAEAVACALDPELEAIKGESRAAFEEALRAAFGALPARTRTLLRLHYVDGMTGDALAKMYGVHRVTVSRWLVDARAEIREAMTRTLRDRLRLSGTDLSPLLSLIRSRLDMSLRALLIDHAV